MTVQLVHQSHLKEQIRNEMLQDSNSYLINRKTNLSKHQESTENEYLELCETSSSTASNLREDYDFNFDNNKHENLFYKFILNSILFFMNVTILIKIYVLQFYYFLYFLFKYNKVNDQDYIKSLNLSIPKHVVVILNENLNSEDKIKDKYLLIIDIMSLSRVETITFYRFESHTKEFKEYILKKHQTNFDLNKNQKQETKKTQINFLSNEDGGKNLIVQACKNLANKVLSNQIKVKDINQELVDSQILEISDLMEPQMVISIGIEDTLAGFCPWHVRLSEIIESEAENLSLDLIEIQVIINQALKNLFGEIGSVGLSPKVLKYDSEKRLLILEISEKSTIGLTQALCLTNGICETNIKKIYFKILNVSKFLSNLDVNSRNDFNF